MGVGAAFVALTNDGAHDSGPKHALTLNSESDARPVKAYVIDHCGLSSGSLPAGARHRDDGAAAVRAVRPCEGLTAAACGRVRAAARR
jgi:hypothetical protein